MELVGIGDVAWKLALMFVLAFLAETLTEYFARPFLKYDTLPGNEPPSNGQRVVPAFVLRYIAAVVGVAIAFGYRADVLAILGLPAVHPFIGYLVTGLIIGRGANYLHDLVDRWLAPVQRPTFTELVSDVMDE